LAPSPAPTIEAVSVDRGNSRVLLRVYARGSRPLVAEIELDEFCAVLLVELLQTAITRPGTPDAGAVNRG
jgi:hypothetical protein